MCTSCPNRALGHVYAREWRVDYALGRTLRARAPRIGARLVTNRQSDCCATVRVLTVGLCPNCALGHHAASKTQEL